MMRTFKRQNVVKLTDSDKKASQLLAQGYTEVVEAEAAKKPRSRKTGGDDDNDRQSEQAQDTAGD